MDTDSSKQNLTRSESTPATYTGYSIRLGRDGILWRATVFDRHGRSHYVTQQPATLGTLLKLAGDMLEAFESR